MKISEIITDKYKLRIPPTVYYELLADVQEVEEEQEPTTNNDLGVDCISRQAAIDLLAIGEEFLRRVLDEVDVIGHEREKYEWGLGLVESYISDMEELPSVTPQEPQSFKWCTDCKEYDQEKHCCHRWSKVIRDTVEEMKQEQEPCDKCEVGNPCLYCKHEFEPQESEDKE